MIDYAAERDPAGDVIHNLGFQDRGRFSRQVIIDGVEDDEALMDGWWRDRERYRKGEIWYAARRQVAEP